MTLHEPYIHSDFTQHQLVRAVIEGVFIAVSFARADLTEARLSGTFFDVDFTEANLVGAQLHGEFRGTTFQGADLAFSNLRNATIPESDLQSAHSLRGAIMPDGSYYTGHLRLPGD